MLTVKILWRRKPTVGIGKRINDSYSSSDEDHLYDHGTPFQGRREGDPGVPVTPPL